jgi:hypothetical protein
MSPKIGRLEMHVTHVCNLTCESCSHFSNHGHKGRLELAQADAWMSAWRDRIEVGEFVLLGGEPTIHPELTEFVPLVRRHWPRASIVIITNGFFLDRHPGLPRALALCGNARLCLSVHHDSLEYRQRIQPVLDLTEQWRRDHGVSIEVTPSYTNWTRRYMGFGDAKSPFDDQNPRASWQICRARHCRQLFEGKIWKCSPIAYLTLQKRQFRLSESWDRYLNYEPLEPTCSDNAIVEFLAREEEGICSMCPAKRVPLEIPNPIRGAEARSAREVPPQDRAPAQPPQ